MGTYIRPAYKVKRNGVWVLIQPEPVEFSSPNLIREVNHNMVSRGKPKNNKKKKK